MSNSEHQIINFSLASKGPRLLLALNGEVSGPENIDERFSILSSSGSWHLFARVDHSSGVARGLGHRYHHYLPRLEPSSSTP
jgi:hypothetical protein